MTAACVIDVSVPQSPHEVGFFITPGWAYGVTIDGSYSYVAENDTQFGLRVIDVSVPQNPQEVGFYHSPGFTYDVAIAGSHAYLADGNRGLRVIDVSDPKSPQEVGFYVTPSWAYDVAVANSYAYVASFYAGLQIVEFYGGGVEETPGGEVRAANAGPTVVRGVLFLPRDMTGLAGNPDRVPRPVLLDVSGRKALDLAPGANDVGGLAPGVYFVAEPRTRSQELKTATKVVVQK